MELRGGRGPGSEALVRMRWVYDRNLVLLCCYRDAIRHDSFTLTVVDREEYK